MLQSTAERPIVVDLPTPSDPQRAVDAVSAAAETMLALRKPERLSILQRLFPGRGERRSRHHARRFIGALDLVQQSQPGLLSAEQLAAIKGHVDRVIDRMEDQLLKRPPTPTEGATVATIIYKTRARFEEILMAVEHAKRPARRPGRL